ncbi:hypothetical protein A3A64_04845 [Candidatus Gottesmanbacteria bacterium RIFCSPLOWO2_01_FULL_48_11]|uniref:EamA domain-containing protein n=3 Tax=Candidatus Gottesmaniibacteriota TaxID=1752720 RepID=A0A0G1UPP9_9BACT|nr:MAG: hypothetical protein UY16_C0035G0004 [Candidatus Gottesmanbacteria bacterium GW2011_GWA2_47_9]KKU96099.1 MAG: hypothetical protein UY27_C0004G0029 [Candidatus Gottesmanbacteria bacterium GW2011_GWA1_48_13]OGG27827.1 MAG: hypothetical protein A3A64_04845 [Candidatus Gottesmanbacteria bacterium RIFCSPLOWO2_01_FULL_48_11]
MSSGALTLIALLVASIFWATSGFAAKTLLKHFDPITLGAIRLTVASLVILPIFLRTTKRITKKMVLDMLPVSLFSAGNFILFLFGIQRTTANAAAVIYTVTPLVAAFLSKKFIQEHVSGKKLAGILLGLVGVLTILVLPVLEQRGVIVGDIGGNLMIVGAMIFFALYNVGSRHLIAAKSYHPITITGFSLVVSACLFIIVNLFVPHAPIFPTLRSPSILLLAIYMGIFVTVLPYILHQWAVKHSSATTAALTTYIQPVFAFMFNGFLLGEVITPGFLFGSILVFAGVFLATGTGLIRMARGVRNAR